MNPVQVTLEIEPNNQEITLGFSEYIRGGGNLPWYDGSYSVTPTPSGETLPTKLHGMRANLDVEPIPYSEVTNPSGGKTVNIAFVL